MQLDVILHCYHKTLYYHIIMVEESPVIFHTEIN